MLPACLLSDSRPLALLTAGESLPRVWDPALANRYQLVFAVNRAGASYPHDVLCYIDSFVSAWAIDQAWPRARIAHLTTYARHYHPPQLPLYGMDLYNRNQPGQATRCRKSFPAALFEVAALARSAGLRVDVYGLDMSHAPGHRGDRAYDETRWELEALWMALAWPDRCRVFGDIDPRLLADIEALAAARPLCDLGSPLPAS